MPRWARFLLVLGIFYCIGAFSIHYLAAPSKDKASLPPPATEYDPASLLRWAVPFADRPRGGWDLALLARTQATIADWEGAAATLKRLETMVKRSEAQGRGKSPTLAETRWIVEQIRLGNEPQKPPQYPMTPGDEGPDPAPVVIPLSYFANRPSDHPLTAVLKAAWGGRFDDARELAWKEPRVRWRIEFLLRTAKAQIALADTGGARQTLEDTKEFVLTLADPEPSWIWDDGPNLRQGSLSKIAVLLAEAGDFDAAQRVLKMLRHKTAQSNAAHGIAVQYARINDRKNAALMVSRIPSRQETVEATVNVVRILIQDWRGQSKWPYSRGNIMQLHRFAIGCDVVRGCTD